MTLDHDREVEMSRMVFEKPKTMKQFHQGTMWFFLIAVLSLINSTLTTLGAPSYFVIGLYSWIFSIGLGFTQWVDMIGRGVGEFGPYLATFIDFVAAILFVLFGIFSAKRYEWVYILGIGVYAADAILPLLLGHPFGTVFHLFILYPLISGLMAGKKLTRTEQAEREFAHIHGEIVPGRLAERRQPRWIASAPAASWRRGRRQ
jgi:hypothetical protein